MGKVLSSAATLPPFTVSRRLPGHAAEREARRRHARQIGEIVYAWNSAHGALFWVFWTMLGKGHATAHGLWHTVQSDSLQRQMLTQLAEKSELHTKSIKKAVLWTTAAMNELAPLRNAAAHVQMYYYYTELVPSEVTSKQGALRRLSESPIESYWRRLRGDLRAIELYAMDLHLALMGHSARPLTRRPKLMLVKPRPSRASQR